MSKVQNQISSITKTIDIINSKKLTKEEEKKKDILEMNKEKAKLTKDIVNLRYEKQKHSNERFLFEKQILEETQILCTTLNSAGNDRLHNVNLKFK